MIILAGCHALRCTQVMCSVTHCLGCEKCSENASFLAVFQVCPAKFPASHEVVSPVFSLFVLVVLFLGHCCMQEIAKFSTEKMPLCTGIITILCRLAFLLPFPSDFCTKKMAFCMGVETILRCLKFYLPFPGESSIGIIIFCAGGVIFLCSLVFLPFKKKTTTKCLRILWAWRGGGGKHTEISPQWDSGYTISNNWAMLWESARQMT